MSHHSLSCHKTNNQTKPSFAHLTSFAKTFPSSTPHWKKNKKTVFLFLLLFSLRLVLMQQTSLSSSTVSIDDVSGITSRYQHNTHKDSEATPRVREGVRQARFDGRHVAFFWLVAILLVFFFFFSSSSSIPSTHATPNETLTSPTHQTKPPLPYVRL